MIHKLNVDIFDEPMLVVLGLTYFFFLRQIILPCFSSYLFSIDSGDRFYDESFCSRGYCYLSSFLDTCDMIS